MISETIKYTRERNIFDQPVLNNQIVHYTLAELTAEVELLRSAVYRATGILFLHFQQLAAEVEIFLCTLFWGKIHCFILLWQK